MIFFLFLFFSLFARYVIQVVVITGASSGIGEALAHEFYGYGCKVVLASRRIGELERVRRNLLNTKLPTGIESHRPDIVPLDLEQIQQLPDKAHSILRSNLHVDILINNGGISLRSDALTVKQEVDVQIMNINYFGAIALTKGKYISLCTRKLFLLFDQLYQLFHPTFRT